MSAEHIKLHLQDNAQVWEKFIIAIVVAVLGAGVLYHQTVWHMVTIWYKSDTYTHGFLILPLIIWLVWEKRHYLVRMIPESDFRVILLTVPVGFLWLLANAADVQVVQELAFVSSVIIFIWAILGNTVATFLVFPLLFMYFAVPMGEGLIPSMMEFTTNFTVALIKLTGIPVYREGNFFSVPSGDWSVVEACSGVRYLIASICLGVIYAYLTYQKTHKRLIFILFSVLVPIIANGLRAYMIVMIGHLSDMKLAVGVDHLIYGWVFFGIVITIMFLVGSWWRDPVHVLPEIEVAVDNPHTHITRQKPYQVLAVGLILLGIWPLLGKYIEGTVLEDSKEVTIALPDKIESFFAYNGEAWDWKPNYRGEDAELTRFYSDRNRLFFLHVDLYTTQRQGTELIRSTNKLLHTSNKQWRIKGAENTEVRLDDGLVQIKQIWLGSRTLNLLVWHWYRVGEYYTGNPYVVKLLEAGSKLLNARSDASSLVVATTFEDNVEEAIPELQRFVDGIFRSLEQALDRAVER